MVRDSIFRIASMSKPIAAVAALILVEECRVRLDDPVHALLPELADRTVLIDGRGPLDGATEPARRPITLHDLLTFRLGWGMDFGAGWPQPLLDPDGRAGARRRSTEPSEPPDPDEWLKRLGTLPLQYQPGERWLYNVGVECARRVDRGLPSNRSRCSCASACSSRSGWPTRDSGPVTPSGWARHTVSIPATGERYV